MSDELRKGFIEILGAWSMIADVRDIPMRLKRIKKFTEEHGALTEGEEKIVTFMKDVQLTRTMVRTKPTEDLEDADVD